MMPKCPNIIYVVLAAGVLWTCSDNALFDEAGRVPEEGWNFKDKLDFSFAVTDTSRVYDIMVHVRNRKDYSYSNLWLFLGTTAPDGAMQKDTLEIMLTDESGQWLGKGTRSINTMLVPYIKSVKFPQLGVYNMTIQHAMRDTVLYNLSDIGVRIQYSE